MSIQIVSVLEGRGLVRAVFEIDYAGLRLRGLKLQRHQDQWRLATPGRKIQDSWQLLYDIRDPVLQSQWLGQLERSC